jgi:hypothetical protein
VCGEDCLFFSAAAPGSPALGDILQLCLSDTDYVPLLPNGVAVVKTLKTATEGIFDVPIIKLKFTTY